MAKTTKKTSTKKSSSPEVYANLLDNPSVVHAFAYFPYFIGAVAMYFFGNSDKKAALHHIKYSFLLSLSVVILLLILNSWVMSVVTLVYIGASIYLALKAYKGEEVKLEILDTIEDKISETVKK